MTRAAGLLALSVLIGQLILAATVFDPTPHIGGDNAGYVILAYSLLERGEYRDLHDPDEPIHTKYPPAYPSVLAAAIGLGARTWTALKALSAVFMAGALALSFLWMERRRGVAFALAITALLAMSEAYLFHSRWVLSDPLFLLLTWTSLWAFSRFDEDQGLRAGGGPGQSGGSALPDPSDRSRSGLWLTLACSAAMLAFFTRSAGVPLVLAVALVLAGRRRWRELTLFGIAFGVPACLWWLRSRGGPNYALEFWLFDPYRPDLGTAGPADLGGRVVANARAYVGRWIPGGLIGLRGGLVTGAGVAMFALAGAGWWERVRSRVGVAEVFTPLYMGLIFLWPVVWAGDRFALPLYGLILFYAGEALSATTLGWSRRARRIAATVVCLPILVPAVGVWWVSGRETAACRMRIQDEGAFACYTEPVREYVKAAEWSAANLPRDARVVTRKPRLFYVLTGIQGRTYPLTRDVDAFLERVVNDGTTHAVMDYLDTLASYYLVPAIEARRSAFCSLVGFGTPGRTRTEILGVLQPEEQEAEAGPAVEGDLLLVSLEICPGSPSSGSADAGPPYSGPVIPLLASMD